MRELNFAEIAAVSGGESTLSLNQLNQLNQTTDATALKGVASTVLTGIISGAAAELGAKIVDVALGYISGSSSSTGTNRGGSNGTDGTSNSGDGHGF